MSRLPILFLIVGTAVACTPAPSRASAQPIKGTSQTMVVRGEYRELALDRVDSMSIEHGKIVFHGGTNVSVDPPAGADPTKIDQHWMLVTEGENDHLRSLTFTHNIALDDFTLDLPASGGQIHYGVFNTASDDKVMVFAWGEKSRSYWGYVTLQHHAAA